MKAYITNAYSGRANAINMNSQAAVDVGEASRVVFAMSANMVATYVRVGDDLVLVFKDGETIRLEDFFREDADGRPILVFDDTGRVGGSATEVSFTHAEEGILRPLVDGGALAAGGAVGGASGAMPWVLGGLIMGGAGIAVAGSDNGNSNGDGSGGGKDKTPPPTPKDFRLDPASDTGPSNKDGITSDTTPTFSGGPGSAEPGSDVYLYDQNGKVVGQTKAKSDGSWEVTSDTLGEGEHYLRAKSVDPSGNESPLSPPVKIVIDTTPPAAPKGGSQLDPASDTGASDSDGITGDDTPTFSGGAGSVPPGSEVYLFDENGKVVGHTKAEPDGSWQITSDTLGEGEHTIVAKAMDPAGNLSPASPPVKIVIDNTPPSTPKGFRLDPASDSGPSDSDGITNDNTPTFSGEPGSAEPEAEVYLYDEKGEVVGQTKAKSDGSWEITLNALLDGEHTFTAKSADPVGNLSAASDPVKVTIDTTPPAAPGRAAPAPVSYMRAARNVRDSDEIRLDPSSDTGSNSRDGITKDDTPTIIGATGSMEPGMTVVLYDSDGKTELGHTTARLDGSWSVKSAKLGQGEHNLTIRVADAAGNMSLPSEPIKVTVDTTSPDAPRVQTGGTLDVSGVGILGDDGHSSDAVMGDVDGDGDLDIYTANFHNQQNKLWINEGNQQFAAGDIEGDTGYTRGAVMGDVDGDGDLDIYAANFYDQQNKLWINEGNLKFTARDIEGDTGNSTRAVMGDVDGDGDLDIYVANTGGQQNKLLINAGFGRFAVREIDGDQGNSMGAVMGDLDGDGDLDIYVVNDHGEQNVVLLNEGNGDFTARQIKGDLGSSQNALMGDVDGDGDLDIYVVNAIGDLGTGDGQNYLWINEGRGTFKAGHIAGDIGDTYDAVLGDVDGDGDLDIYEVYHGDQQNRLLTNDGEGNFSTHYISGDKGRSAGAAIGDVNDDGMPDLYVANYGGQQNYIWLNNGSRITTSDILKVQSTEKGIVYLVNDDVKVTSVEDIIEAADNQWNGVEITKAGADTTLAASGLTAGTYHVYTTDLAGNLSEFSDVQLTIV